MFVPLNTRPVEVPTPRRANALTSKGDSRPGGKAEALAPHGWNVFIRFGGPQGHGLLISFRLRHGVKIVQSLGSSGNGDVAHFPPIPKPERGVAPGTRRRSCRVHFPAYAIVK